MNIIKILLTGLVGVIIKMTEDKEILEIFEKKENSYEDFWEYEVLSHREKMRIFDLLKEREPNIKPKIREELYKYTQKNSHNANKQLKL